MMEPSFEKLLVVLADANVDFVLVGGLAVTLQGYVRFTEDVDILIDSNPGNVAKLLEVLAGYGEGFARDERRVQRTRQETRGWQPAQCSGHETRRHVAGERDRSAQANPVEAPG